MTLIDAIKTGRLYKRGNGMWMNSEHPTWHIRHPSNGDSVCLSEVDVCASNWEVDVRDKYGNWQRDFSQVPPKSGGKNETEY